MESAEFWPRAFLLIFFLLNIVINFWFVTSKRSFYRTGASTSSMTSLPDLNWKKCLDCDQNIPPRAYHCPLCQKCILRRDHHCFFTGSCVGFENQRYFLVFCFYCGIGSAYCFYLMQQYIVLVYLQKDSMSMYHYILPIAALEFFDKFKGHYILMDLQRHLRYLMESLMHRFKTDPSELLQTPEMKVKITPNLLKCMNICGIGYALIVTSMIFVTIMFWVLPEVFMESAEFWPRAFLLIFFLLNIVINFWFVTSKRSFYRTGASTSSMTSLPDLNWKKCLDCDQNIPPRAYHCPLCQKCILRRDHHCFFTGSCVGFENQRYFLVFCFYCGIGSAYCFYLMQQYIVLVYLQKDSMSMYHYILPIAALECLFKYMALHLFYCIFICYLCVFTTLGSLGIFCWQFFLAALGTTTYEYNKGNWSYRKSCVHNLRAVFGPWWLLCFICPVPCIKIPGNGVEWNLPKNL